jgi:hypothetical protein
MKNSRPNTVAEAKYIAALQHMYTAVAKVVEMAETLPQACEEICSFCGCRIETMTFPLCDYGVVTTDDDGKLWLHSETYTETLAPDTIRLAYCPECATYYNADDLQYL